MPAEFKTIGLIGKYGDPSIAETLTTMANFLKEQHLEVWLDDETARTVPDLGLKIADRIQLGQGCDLAVVIGGDGTLLNAARSLSDAGIPMVGINLGRLGFLADISPVTMLDVMKEILAGHYRSEERFLLQGEIIRDGRTIQECDAFNEVVVHKWNMARQYMMP